MSNEALFLATRGRCCFLGRTRRLASGAANLTHCAIVLVVVVVVVVIIVLIVVDST